MLGLLRAAAKRTGLGALPAADALGGIDCSEARFGVFGNRGAAERGALPAGPAVAIHVIVWLSLAMEQNAGGLEHDDRKLVGLVFRRDLQCVAHGFRVMGVNLAHVFDAERRYDADDVEFSALAILKRHAVEGVSLAACHGRRAVVENADGSTTPVVGCGN